MPKLVKMGIIGTGLAAVLHLEGMKSLRGVKVEIAAISARNRAKLTDFAAKYQIPKTYTDWRDLVRDPEIEVIDLCAPTNLHEAMIAEIARYHKHVICEKPLTGFFGDQLGIDLVGRDVPRQQMLVEVQRQIEATRQALAEGGIKFMYAENWVYAPPFRKMAHLLKASGGTILDIRAEASHSGSTAAYSRRWKEAGGGALLRTGAHPVGGVLHLKYLEGMAKSGAPIRPVSVTAEVACNYQNPTFQAESFAHLVKDWVDVEDWGMACINFDDGSKALVLASDCVLGGVKNEMTVYTSNSVLTMDMSQNDTLTSYAPVPGIFGNEYLNEKLSTDAGWNRPAADDFWMRGFSAEMEDFIDCVHSEREPESGWYLAEATLKIIYAAYLSAEQGRRVAL